MALSLKWEELKKNYVDILIQNLDTVSAIEVWTRSLSYLVAGRLSANHSTVIAELLYSSSHLFTMFNDHVLRRHYKLYTARDDNVRWLKMFISSIECIEVFIEIAARRYGNPILKWILIFSIQMIKAIGRSYLLLMHNTRIRLFPIVKRLNRKNMESDSSGDEEPVQSATEEASNGSFYTLNHSGRKIKSLSDRYNSRYEQTTLADESLVETPLTHEQIFAEMLHNIQPLVHLFGAATFGEKSWMPWLTSFLVDVSSLTMLKKKDYRYTMNEDRELTRRKFMLLMYLLRSPFYDRYTKTKILRALAIISKIPGASYVTDAVKAYLPEWQSTYFYVWSS